MAGPTLLMQENSEQRRPNHSQNGRRMNNKERPAKTEQKPAGERSEHRNSEVPQRRLPRIQMQYKDIKLNEEQKAQIDALNEKINALGKPTMPSNEEFNDKKDANEAEIKKLESRSQIIEAQINNFDEKKSVILEKFAPAKKAFQDKQNAFKEAIARSKDVRAKIDSLTHSRNDLQTRQKDQKSKFGYRSIEDAQNMIDEIEYNIERQSLNNNQLKEKLSEIERIKKGINEFSSTDSSESKIANIKEQIESLKAQRTELNTQIEALKAEMDGLSGERAPRSAEVETINNSIRELNNNRKEIRNEIKQKRDNFRAVYHAYRDNRENYFKARNELRDLIFERETIYSVAERHMMQIAEAEQRATEIKVKVNPNSDKISSAKSLIAYLNNLIPVPVAAPVAKQMDEKTLAMLGNIKRKVPKAKKAKKQDQSLVHNIETVAKFSKLDLTAPKSTEQIPAMVEKLHAVIKEFESSFIRAELEITVLPDGKVKSNIRIL